MYSTKLYFGDYCKASFIGHKMPSGTKIERKSLAFWLPYVRAHQPLNVSLLPRSIQRLTALFQLTETDQRIDKATYDTVL